MSVPSADEVAVDGTRRYGLIVRVDIGRQRIVGIAYSAAAAGLREQILSMLTPADLIRRLDELLAGDSHRRPLNITVADAAGAQPVVGGSITWPRRRLSSRRLREKPG